MATQIDNVENTTTARRRAGRKPGRRLTAALATLVSSALIASTLIATAATVSPADAAGASGGTVTGSVFKNFLPSGWKSKATAGNPAGTAVSGITATAYDAEGDVVGSAKSNAAGEYSIAITNAFSNDVRIEFSGWDAALQPAFAAQDKSPAGVTIGNDTSVQFVTLGTPTAVGVDFGLIEPELVTQGNAPIATAIQYPGLKEYDPASARAAVVSQPWGLTGNLAKVTPSLKSVAPYSEVGSLWGLAYDRTTDELYASTVLKRMSEMGPAGLGGIYRGGTVLLPDGELNPAVDMQPWLDVTTLTIANADRPELIDVGQSQLPSDAERGLGAPGKAAHDTAYFALAGRVGLGGIALTADGSRLFAANLHDGQIYAVDTSDSTTAPTTADRVKTPVAASQAIWAVTTRADRLYIGYVDTGAGAGQSAQDAEMKAYVASTSLESISDGEGAAEAVWTQELTAPLGYAKGSNQTAVRVNFQGKLMQAEYPRVAQWNSWSDTWRWGAKKADSVGIEAVGNVWFQWYPQPILSSLVFDSDGYLNLGFTDRTSLQGGNRSYSTDKTDVTTVYETFSNGDILVAAPVEGSTAQAGCAAVPGDKFILECAGKVGARDVRNATENGQLRTDNNKQGPGLGEFFNDQQNQGRTRIGNTNYPHNEVALGALLSYPGLPGVASTAMDPFTALFATGLMWFDQGRGLVTGGVELAVGTGKRGSPSFEKGGGLGAVALLAQAAPVEIGNRVWLDADLNGRQDADEPAINGAVVKLYTQGADGEPEHLIAERTTATIDDQPGTYYFRSDDADVVASETQKHPFTANGAYVLVFENSGADVALVGPNHRHDGFVGLTWADLKRTAAQVAVAPTSEGGVITNGGTNAANDSNAAVADGRFAFTVGGPGENNHTYDAGFYAENGYALDKTFNVEPPADASYDFTVVSARNFRGQDRLIGSGGTPGDPQVATPLTVDAASGWSTSSGNLPLGYGLVLEESDAPAGGVVFDPAVSGRSDQGSVLITPARGTGLSARVKATNTLTGFSVVKTVEGTGAPLVALDAEFQIEYTLDGGDPQKEWVSINRPFTREDLPLGTVVKIRESDPIVVRGGPSEVNWGPPVWSATPALSAPVDGWYTFTVGASSPYVALGLRNTATANGTFVVSKTVETAGDPNVENALFTFLYRVAPKPVGGAAPVFGEDSSFTLRAGETWDDAGRFPEGTIVELREDQPADSTDVVWGTPRLTFNGAAGTVVNGWTRFSIVANGADTASLVSVKNFGSKPAGLSLRKTFDGTGISLVEEAVFPVEVQITGQTDQVVDLSGDGSLWLGPQTLSVGTVVRVREVLPLPEIAGIEWGEPSWSDDGVPLALEDGWSVFTITTEGEQPSLTLKNTPTKLGGFQITKTLITNGDPVVPDDYTFEYTLDGGDPTTVTLQADETSSPIAGLPAGTTVSVRELAPPQRPDVDWTTKWKIAGIETTPVGGWITFEIPADGGADSLVSLEAINEAEKFFGTFTVEKSITGDAAARVPDDASFVVEYSINGGADWAALPTITKQKLTVTGPKLPLDTTVLLREVAPAAGVDYVWGDPEFILDGEEQGDTVSFPIVKDTPNVAVRLENPTTPLDGTFTVEKSITGDASERVPDDASFVVEYSINGGADWAALPTITKQNLTVAGPELPLGTTVLLREVAPAVGVDFAWGDPKFIVDGTEQGDTVSFTITEDAANVAVRLENPTTPLDGTFTVEKSITGDASERVPDDARFVVEYSINGGADWAALPTITKQNLTVAGPEFPQGTTVLLREVAPTAGVDYAWGDPEFILDGEDQGDTVSFTITEDTANVAVRLENPTIPLNGTFAVEKVVEGDFTLTDRELKDLTFTANWSGGSRSGSIVMNVANDWKGAPDGPEFPNGTQITLTEAVVTGLPANVEFDGHSWLRGVAGVTVSLDGETATLTVGTGTPKIATLKNSFRELEGTFQIEKVVDGDFGLSDEELKDLTFLAQYTASNGTSGTLALNADGGWKAAAGHNFPTGTTITLTEVAVDQSALPPNVKWEGYRWQPAAGHTVSTDGQIASLTIGDGTNVALSLRNTFTKLEGAFSVQKLLAGDFTLTDPELRGQSFTVAYSTTNGVEGTLDLNAQNGWSAAAGKLPATTVVTLTELAPKKLAANVGWAGHRWVPAPGLTISADGKSATLTIDSGVPTARLSLRNTLTERDGGFSVEKVVAGEFTLDSTELSGLSFAVPYTASNGAKGTLALNKAGEWTAGPGEEFPVGTVITVTEADVTGLPAHVKWSGHRWLPGEGYTVSDDGTTASFTIADQPTQPKLTLQNSFEKLLGGFTMTKQVTGAAAERVPGELEFLAEFSLDGGSSWNALPAVTKDNPVATGPADVPLGTTVLIRELAPAAVPGVTWGAPAFSGAGVKPGAEGEPSSFVITSGSSPVQVLLSNPTTPSNGQFQVTKEITGAGSSLLKGEPVFTVKYSYQGQQGTGEFTLRAGEFASSEPIPTGTLVTITEVTPEGGLVKGASWGAPVFVLADGSVLQNGATITIGADTVLALRLENPTRPEIPSTGIDGLQLGLALVLLLGGAGLLLMLFGRRRRRITPRHL